MITRQPTMLDFRNKLLSASVLQHNTFNIMPGILFEVEMMQQPARRATCSPKEHGTIMK
ncbi:hypothetical protein [Prosthecobacter sp.]|uniref:hypothetical protein n=1 Tax=Prosthecobacter sp. TaxID=1965333 RepID=UPI001D9CF9AC|nr:hypothetical protein [Prosthecobacter sp.]MCB1279084.1 hypothetical protein [Prosthecobacter sp.]